MMDYYIHSFLLCLVLWTLGDGRNGMGLFDVTKPELAWDVETLDRHDIIPQLFFSLVDVLFFCLCLS